MHKTHAPHSSLHRPTVSVLCIVEMDVADAAARVRCRVPSTADADEVLRAVGHEPASGTSVEVWLDDGWAPLGGPALRSPSRLRVSSSDPASELLALPGRLLPADLDDGSFSVGGRPLRISTVDNSDLGTALVVWDGAVNLARYLERNPALVFQKSVLELGAGTGVAGLAAGLLGARSVVLTDLPCVENGAAAAAAAAAASNSPPLRYALENPKNPSR